jgi:hypothetical protein
MSCYSYTNRSLKLFFWSWSTLIFGYISLSRVTSLIQQGWYNLFNFFVLKSESINNINYSRSGVREKSNVNTEVCGSIIYFIHKMWRMLIPAIYVCGKGSSYSRGEYNLLKCFAFCFSLSFDAPISISLITLCGLLLQYAIQLVPIVWSV